MAFTIQTERLELFAGAAEHLWAALANHNLLPDLLKVKIPRSWPPPLTEEALQPAAEKLDSEPDLRGWLYWLILLKEEEQKILIGIAGFKGLPDKTGTVEIGYAIAENYQNRGYTTEAVQALLNWAFQNHSVKRVVARTFPGLQASIRVLEKSGFKRTGKSPDKNMLKFEITREAFRNQML